MTTKRHGDRAEALRITERQWGSTFEDLCKLTGRLYYHTQFSYRSAPGYPDYTVIFEDTQKVMWFELKSKDGKVTPRQRVWLDALVRAGQAVFVARPDDFEEVWAILAGKPAPEGGWTIRWTPRGGTQ